MRFFTRTQSHRVAILVADVFIACLIVMFIAGFWHYLRLANAPFTAEFPTTTEISALPEYALLSLIRSLLALILSYAFAVAYGTFAARSKAHARVMIPLLDVLQSLPVLAFLPGFVILLIALFQQSRWGIELACVLNIFTGQTWNLVFAYYQSQKELPTDLVDVARLSALSPLQRFLTLDLPNGVRPLVYNGMMSMAGGWFFLTVCEAFVLDDVRFVLPGLGSFLSQTLEKQDYTAFAAGLAALGTLIVGVDLVLWKPLIAWVSRFADDGAQETESWFLEVLRRTRFTQLFAKALLQLRLTVQALNSRRIQALTEEFLGRFPQMIAPRVRQGTSRNLLSWVLPFVLGSLVFWTLPKLPSIALKMSLVTADDWLSLTRSLLFTVIKVLGVLVLATVWTLPVGIWIGQNPRVARFAQPLIQNLAAFPAPVLFPVVTMAALWAGLAPDANALLLMCLGNQWYLLFNVISGASKLPADLKSVAQLYRLSPWRKLRYFYFPGILPSLATGWMAAAGGSWNTSIVAEMVRYPGGVAEARGIGAEITRATTSGNFPRLVAAVVLIVVALVIMNRTIWKQLNNLVARLNG